jgi:hypothetical protein
MGGISFARGWRIYQTLSVAVVVAMGGGRIARSCYRLVHVRESVEKVLVS